VRLSGSVDVAAIRCISTGMPCLFLNGSFSMRCGEFPSLVYFMCVSLCTGIAFHNRACISS
jgi:hypothetical protein